MIENYICIIGGSGFIGTRLTRLVSKMLKVHIIDKNTSQRFNNITSICDIRDKTQLKSRMKNFDLVIHLAAEHRDDVNPASLYYDVNVEGTNNIIEAMVENDIHNIIFTSSVAVYGLNKDNPNEAHPVDPFNDYGKSKWQAEEKLREWYNQKPEKRNLTIIRPTVVFGENNRGNVYNLLKQISSGKFIKVGNGLNKKSMAYVGNIAAFITYCLSSTDGYQLFNYVDKPDLNMNQLTSQVEKSLDKKIPATRLPCWIGMLGGYGFDVLHGITRKQFSISSVRVKKFCATTQFDANKAHSCGFTSPYSLNEGLDKTLKYEFINKTE